MASAPRVPFLDLALQDATVGAAVRAAVADVLAGRQFILGPHVERFEQAMAAYTGVRHAIGVGSGTDALALAMAGLGVAPGDLVVTSPFTFFATASTIVRLGARPLFVDVDPRTMNLDPDRAADALEAPDGRVVGCMPVHLFGRLAAMDVIEALAARHGLWIVEDAAQAVGARAGGRAAGARGRAGCFSFYPSKNLGGAGDGGMVVTSDDGLAAHVRRERHQGQSAPYEHATIGLCSRLDALQAAVLGAKLPHLDGWNDARRRVAAGYADAFERTGLPDGRTVLALPEPAGEAHVFHQYVIRVRERDALVAHLGAAGVGVQVYYRTPLHRQPALAGRFATAGSLPEAERAAAEVVALPIYPELTPEQIALVVGEIAAFYRARR